MISKDRFFYVLSSISRLGKKQSLKDKNEGENRNPCVSLKL